MHTRDLLSAMLRDQFGEHPRAAVLATEVTDNEWVLVQEQEPRWAEQAPEVMRRALNWLVDARRAHWTAGTPTEPRRRNRRPDVRQRAISELFALEAANNASVRDFRARVLGDVLLAGHELRPWITKQQQAQGQRRRTRTRRTRAEGVQVPLACRFPESGWVSWIPTTRGSVLDRLRRTGEALSASYGWHPAEATLFVLTGYEPPHQPIRATVRHRVPMQVRSRIVLEINPMATPTDVAEAYARARRLHFGTRLRRLSDKHAELAHFQLTHGMLDSSEARTEWNRSHPKFTYKSLSVFHRDRQQAVVRLREMSLRPIAPHLP